MQKEHWVQETSRIIKAKQENRKGSKNNKDKVWHWAQQASETRICIIQLMSWRGIRVCSSFAKPNIGQIKIKRTERLRTRVSFEWQSSHLDTRLQGSDRNTWSGCATSEKITSTMPTSIRYLAGCLASSIMGITLVLFFAMLTRSLPLLWENSTA